MQITDEVFDLLRQDYQLRKVISDKLDTRIVNVERWSDRKRVPNWYKDEFIQIISRELQLTKNQIEC